VGPDLGGEQTFLSSEHLNWVNTCQIRSRGDVDIRIRRLPQIKKPVYLTMVEPENWIKSSNSRVRHMSISANVDMNLVVDPFKRGQGTLITVDKIPSMVGKLAPRIRLEQNFGEEIENPLPKIIACKSRIRDSWPRLCIGVCARIRGPQCHSPPSIVGVPKWPE